MKIIKYQEKSSILYCPATAEWVSDNRIEFAEPEYNIRTNISKRGWNQMWYWWLEYEFI